MEGAEAGTSQEVSGLDICLDKPGKGQMRHCLKGPLVHSAMSGKGCGEF